MSVNSEEVQHRGFLIRYLSNGPWHAGLRIALAIASISFGLGHGYQGLSGIIGTAVLGAVMAVIFLASGSLWLTWFQDLSSTRSVLTR